MKLILATLLAAVVALQGCGGSDDEDGADSSADSNTTAFYTPSYGDARSDTRWRADLKSVTNQVVSYQDAGSELASLVGSTDNELVQLFADYKVGS